MKPKIQRKIEFINTCECMFDSEVLEQAILWFSPDNLKTPRKIYMHGNYPAVSVYDKKIHVHRLLGLFLNKNKLLKNVVVHHIDHNKLNSLPNNLDVICRSLHASHHNKGKKLTHSHKNKIAEASKKRVGIKMKRKYDIPIDELKLYLDKGYSISRISRIYGCDWSVIRSRINENPDLLNKE